MFPKLQVLDDFCRNASNKCMLRHVLRHHSTSCHNAVAADGDAWKNNRISSHPHIVANRDRLSTDALLIYPQCCIREIMIKGRHGDALRQIDMTAYGDRADDGVMKAYAGVIADKHIAYGIVDARKRLHHTFPAQ